ncbi:MAG: NBR1-Ig-like domain-containing protein [Anaerolineaceae bacterium]|nr:NBR1-Ig-like domain-containing protein [Anaerolineaceae bacterium]
MILQNKRKSARFLCNLMLLSLAFGLSACQKTSPATPTDVLADIRTAAAETVNALTTQIVSTSLLTQTPANQTAQLPPNPGAVTPSPPATLPALPTSLNATQSIQAPCDLAEFISETIPDGTYYAPGSTFTKTWTFKNAGACTWTAQYALVFISGNAMGAQAAQPITANSVKPGEQLTVSVPLSAPQTEGTYRGDFKLRNAAGAIFAFKDPQKSFWAEIRVEAKTIAGSINLADSLCLANWSNGTNTLPCPGKLADSQGYALSDPAPVLENNAVDDENALILGVPNAENSFIRGIYPPFQVPEGAAFSAILGCSGGSPSCQVKLDLSYLEGSAAPQQIAAWDEHFDGAYQDIHQDLSFLAGRQIRFILTLQAKSSPADGRIHLMAPLIGPR